MTEQLAELSPAFRENSERSSYKTPSGRIVRTLGAKIMKERWAPDPPLKAFVKGYLDVCVGIVVVINVISMIIHSQWVAWKIDVELGLAAAEDTMLSTQLFDTIEYVFFTIYFLDLLVRLIVLRSEWYFDPKIGCMYMNIFDLLLVLLNFTELFVLPLADPASSELKANHVRLIKFTRVARTLRVIRGKARTCSHLFYPFSLCMRQIDRS